MYKINMRGPKTDPCGTEQQRNDYIIPVNVHVSFFLLFLLFISKLLILLVIFRFCICIHPLQLPVNGCLAIYTVRTVIIISIQLCFSSNVTAVHL